MRILMVTSLLPHPNATSGGALVMYGQLTVLATRHQVTLATFAGANAVEGRRIKDLRALGIDVHYISRSWPSGSELWRRRLRDATAWLRGGRPLRALQFFDQRMQCLLDRLLSEESFDLLQVEDNAMGNYSYRTQIPAVFTEHEVRSTLPSQREDPVKTNWIQRALSEAERQRWQEYQPAVWRRFNRIQAFTLRDATAIQTMAPELANRVRLNSFGVEIPKAADPSCEEPGTVVFTGAFGHRPNVDAALWLGREIMPRLRILHRGVRLIIVGTSPTKSIRALASKDVVVTGEVPAVEPFLERAAVVLAPLRNGGGMRVKVLQAMALGKAVVTTPVGAEGLSATGLEPPVALAKDAEEIARSTAALLASRDTRHALGRHARRFVAKHHTWQAYGQRLEAIYAELQSIDRLTCRHGAAG